MYNFTLYQLYFDVYKFHILNYSNLYICTTLIVVLDPLLTYTVGVSKNQGETFERDNRSEMKGGSRRPLVTRKTVISIKLKTSKSTFPLVCHT